MVLSLFIVADKNRVDVSKKFRQIECTARLSTNQFAHIHHLTLDECRFSFDLTVHRCAY